MVKKEKRARKIDNICECYVNVRTCRDDRLPELLWFCREFERLVTEKATSEKMYDQAMDHIVELKKITIAKFPHLSEFRRNNQVPPTDHLERLFSIKLPKVIELNSEIVDMPVKIHIEKKELRTFSPPPPRQKSIYDVPGAIFFYKH